MATRGQKSPKIITPHSVTSSINLTPSDLTLSQHHPSPSLPQTSFCHCIIHHPHSLRPLFHCIIHHPLTPSDLALSLHCPSLFHYHPALHYSFTPTSIAPSSITHSLHHLSLTHHSFHHGSLSPSITAFLYDYSTLMS